MKVRNYLMYWANRLMDPAFKNEYYQANLNQFWTHTYEALCLSSGASAIISLVFFPWGMAFSEYHPLYHAGWGFALSQFGLSGIITFFAIVVSCRFIPEDKDKLERSVWLFVGMFISTLMLQHFFTKLVYQRIPGSMGASLIPLTVFLASVFAIGHIPNALLDKINDVKNKALAGVAFMVMDPQSGSFRLTLLLEKILGKQPVKPHSVIKDLEVPKPKDYKIWGVKSSAEKELQKMLDE